MARVAAVIFHPEPAGDAGPLVSTFAAIRRRNAERHAAGFSRYGAEAEIADDLRPGETFGDRVRSIARSVDLDGLVLLGSGAVPLARSVDRRAFVRVAAGPPGRVLANNRYSADIVAIAGPEPLRRLGGTAGDNGLPRWLAAAGLDVDDLHDRWRLQVDLDSPLDALLTDATATASALGDAGVSPAALGHAWSGVLAATRDPRLELLVAGRTSARGLAWLERMTASRTRALIEERGFRTRMADQRPVRSSLGLILDRDGPESLGARLAELGDAAVVDTRVLLAHRLGADERAWPGAEDRFASDLLLPDRVADPWLRAITEAAVAAPIPVMLGGHTLVGPGVRLLLGRGPTWT